MPTLRAMDALDFRKMHGLGNDFVVLDARPRAIDLAPDELRHLADRRQGIGCDQVIVLEPSARADVFMRIFNADGSAAGACGNAARCIAWLVAGERGWRPLVIETVAGLLPATARPDGWAEVAMGVPALGWADIPLAEPRDTLHLGIERDPLADPVGVGMGNPHAVFFVDDAETVDLASLGPALEHDPLFPDRANIGVAQVLAPDRVRLRVWERGVGLTLACGSGACAALVAAVRRDLTQRAVRMVMDGGELALSWPDDDASVTMGGPSALVFEGRIALPRRAAAAA